MLNTVNNNNDSVKSASGGAKKALITGVTGQDGSYLAELLLEKGYKVYGMNRRTSTPNYSRIKGIVDQIELISGDLLDQHSLTQAIKDIQPDEIYNLAAQSFVKARNPSAVSEMPNLRGTVLILQRR